MSDGQFYTRLILNIIFGIMFGYALVRMAKHNNQEMEPRKHIVMKIFGWLFVCMSGFLLLICIVSFVDLEFHPSVVGSNISNDTIDTPTSDTLYRDFVTVMQISILLTASGGFTYLGIGGYFLFYKSSKSKWGEKILKFFAVLFLLFFMLSSTNFYYFNSRDFVSPILFIILWALILYKTNRTSKPTVNHVISKKDNILIDSQSENIITKTANQKYKDQS